MNDKKDSLIKFMMEYDTEEKCINHFTSIRWKNGEYCAKCGSTKKIYHYKDGRHKCKECKKVFSIKVGTIFENSNIPLRTWLIAIYMLTSDKKGVSSYQIADTLGISQKTAWFMMQRIRETSKNANMPMKKLSGTVEIDATFIGGKEKNKHSNKRLHQGRGTAGKTAVMGAVSRESEQIIAYPVGEESRDTAEVFIANRIEKGSMIYADNSSAYNGLVALRVNHSKGEYVRGSIHTNSIEGMWSIFKRGIYGVYHHVSDKHLKRYVNEFVSRMNTKDLSNRDRVNLMLNYSNSSISYKELVR